MKLSATQRRAEICADLAMAAQRVALCDSLLDILVPMARLNRAGIVFGITAGEGLDAAKRKVLAFTEQNPKTWKPAPVLARALDERHERIAIRVFRWEVKVARACWRFNVSLNRFALRMEDICDEIEAHQRAAD